MPGLAAEADPVRGVCPVCGEFRCGALGWHVGTDGDAVIVARCELDGAILMTNGQIAVRA